MGALDTIVVVKCLFLQVTRISSLLNSFSAKKIWSQLSLATWDVSRACFPLFLIFLCLSQLLLLKMCSLKSTQLQVNFSTHTDPTSPHLHLNNTPVLLYACSSYYWLVAIPVHYIKNGDVIKRRKRRIEMIHFSLTWTQFCPSQPVLAESVIEC